MSPSYLTRALLALLPLCAGACSGEANDALFSRETGDGAGSLAGDDGDAPPPDPRVGNFPGAGTSGSGAPLAAGLGPDTAGACASDVVLAPTTTAAPVETLCLYSEDDESTPAATLEQVLETLDERQWVHVRLTLNPSFVDNSYGDAAIGWQGREKPRRDPAAAPDGALPPDPARAEDAKGREPRKPEGEPKPAMARAAHGFRDLLGSDHAELQLFDGAGDVALHFKLDYLSASASAPSGYASLGVSGGDGKMLVGEPGWILAATSSLDRNLNGCGLAAYTESSPPTDGDYTPSPEASAWDYRVVYEVWIDPAAFAERGFGTAAVEFVHASPSKFPSDTTLVTPGPCPPADVPPLDDDGIVVFPEDPAPTIR